MIDFGMTFRIAVRALRVHKLRSLLTMLGIIIGVGAVVAMVSVGQGATAQIKERIASLGANVIMVFPGSFTAGAARGGAGNCSTPSVAASVTRWTVKAARSGLTCRTRAARAVPRRGLRRRSAIRGRTIRIRPCPPGTICRQRR